MNIVQKVILDMGGYQRFSVLMQESQSSTAIREIAEGKRIPAEITRRKMVKASRGRLTERDIIAISGRTRHDSAAKFEVDPMWDSEPDDLRRTIWRKSMLAARKQRLANERRRR